MVIFTTKGTEDHRGNQRLINVGLFDALHEKKRFNSPRLQSSDSR